MGPYYVVEKKSDVTYSIAKTLTDPKTTVVHINRLRKAEFAEFKETLTSSVVSNNQHCENIPRKPIIFRDERDVDDGWAYGQCHQTDQTASKGTGREVDVAHLSRLDNMQAHVATSRGETNDGSPLLPDRARTPGVDEGPASSLRGDPRTGVRHFEDVGGRGATDFGAAPQVENRSGEKVAKLSQEPQRRGQGGHEGGRDGSPAATVREGIHSSPIDVLVEPRRYQYDLPNTRRTNVGGMCESKTE